MFALKILRNYSNRPKNLEYIKLSSIKRLNMMVFCTSCNNLLAAPVHIQALYPDKYDSLLQPVKRHNLRFIQNAFYTSPHRKEFNMKLEKSKKLLTETIETKRKNLQERKENLVQGIREKKARVQEKMEEYVERENILTIPNLLCVTRGMIAPYLGYVIVHEQYTLAFSLFAIAGITDLLDGFIARNWASQASKIGSFLDPMADKLLVGSLVLSLAYCNLFPVWLMAMMLLRDVFLIIAGLVIRYISLPPPRTVLRYFDATHVTAKLKPTFTSKINTGVQLVAIATSLGAPIWGYVDHSALHSLWYFTGATTLAAALSYVFSKNTYRIIREGKVPK